MKKSVTGTGQESWHIVDTKRHAVESQVEVGDQLLRNTKTNKLSPNYDPSACEVIEIEEKEVVSK